MKNSFLLLLIIACLVTLNAHCASIEVKTDWQAHWITSDQCKNDVNSWLCFRKTVNVSSKPSRAIAQIACDSKYWLWVNGKQVVFEGGLKRGPNPNDTYYDEVDLSSYLVKGQNTISILVWYFGKDGFSHKSSGKAGLLFECITPAFRIISDKSWIAAIHPAFENTQGTQPNVRLPESNIRFDARKDFGNWQNPKFDPNGKVFKYAVDLGLPPVAPWNKLVKRPIPLWKNYGLKSYSQTTLKQGKELDTLICRLPYNAQITPYLQVNAPEGQTIQIFSDNYWVGGEASVRAEYITRKGVQQFESPGWFNGHKVYYLLPKGVKLTKVLYRETGYNTEFSGSFNSSDPFFNRLWEKARRTLYVTMRDTYMDCPDRERAQWIGDEVTEAGESFYALDPKSHLLQRKGLHELLAWQRADNTLFAPIPAGNWNKELPCQILTCVGYYGLWNYYKFTGDSKTIADLYDGVKKYIDVWKINDKGTVTFRPGEWTWGDWGDNIDQELIDNTLFYMALKGVRNMAAVLGKSDDVKEYNQIMDRFKKSFNEQFWTGKGYRHPEYKGQTDDRIQALAVVGGLADKDKFPSIFEVLKKEEHASPYMEKYVLESLFQMGYDEYALERMKKRFEPMVDDPNYTTLFEVWSKNYQGYSGWTINHAWSGGGLTLLSQYLCGIAPEDAGFTRFHILPQPGKINEASATMSSVKGKISSSFKQSHNEFDLTVEIPKKTEAIVGVPGKDYKEIKINGVPVWENGKFIENSLVKSYNDQSESHVKFLIPSGKW
ncbi:MAG: alpha-L-rhamnosidase C-terminal domain-containing protein, partial [Bacteroidota bacterium]|nr:alpha-L-rhamnosidase C-terminal domain-containing protein [Bacteroidota bacterium]